MRKSKPIYFYIFVGMVIGWTTSLLGYLYLGGSNAVWSLAIFGGGVMFLGCIHFYSKANNVPVKSDKKDEKKSFLRRKKKPQVWENE